MLFSTIKSLPAITYLSLGISWLATQTPVQALEVQIVPDAPQLGDTISIIIETEESQSPPKVFMDEQDYPVFPLDNQGTYRALLPTSPLSEPGKVIIKVEGAEKTRNLAVWLQDRSFPTQSITLTGAAASPASNIELERVAEFRTIVTPQKFWDGLFLRPNNGRISAVFGVQRYINGVFAENYYHRGVDYAGSYGSPVVAPAAGRVALIGTVDEGFRIHGNTIGIDHGQGVLSVFLHLSSIEVEEGDFVRPGQLIGKIGSTGASTGPHLHWGLFVNGVAVDPVPWRFVGIE